MKTDMPFYGIRSQARAPIYREMKRRFPPASLSAYKQGVLALWALPHREEKYAAIEYATQAQQFIAPVSLSLYETLIREGGWWDLVDGVATHLVGDVLRTHRVEVAPVMDQWIEDDDLWIRRTAIISQVGHKLDADEERLFDYCKRQTHEKDFFIRKAIGWVLRDHAKSAPDAVRAFLKANQEHLSGLSYREASKHL